MLVKLGALRTLRGEGQLGMLMSRAKKQCDCEDSCEARSALSTPVTIRIWEIMGKRVHGGRFETRCSRMFQPVREFPPKLNYFGGVEFLMIFCEASQSAVGGRW